MTNPKGKQMEWEYSGGNKKAVKLFTAFSGYLFRWLLVSNATAFHRCFYKIRFVIFNSQAIRPC